MFTVSTLATMPEYSVEVIRAGPWDRDRTKQAPSVVRVAELDPLQPLDDVNGLAAVRGEIKVVGERNRDSLAVGAAGVDVDHGEAARPLVVDVQRAHVPGRCDVMRDESNRKVVDDLEGQRVDNVHGARGAVGHVNARRQLTKRARDDA